VPEAGINICIRIKMDMVIAKDLPLWQRTVFGLVLPFIFGMSAPPTQKDCASVSLYTYASFPVGVALDTEKLKFDERYWQVAVRHFNSFTPENILKADQLHPSEQQYNFNEIDHLMDFCAEKKIRLHGHTLIWHEALPVWIQKYKGDREDWKGLMKNHISTIIKHCSSGIKSWDVVNEALNDDGSLRKTIWLEKIGPEYIKLAFSYAREADPGVLLFYNDYSMEANGPKCTAALQLCSELRKIGVLDGVGFQMHVKLNEPSITQIHESLKKFSGTGLLIHLSELDVRLIGTPRIFTAGKKRLEMQKERFAELVSSYRTVEAAQRFGITMWGVSDRDSWISQDHIRARPMLFDAKYQAKPAFCGFVQGLQGPGSR
jgi:endo-1,4-beta-xylanase